MSSTLPRLDEPGDAELISAVRAGDVTAYGELFRRHVDAARRLARQLVSAGDVDDLVSDAFAKVLGVLQRGGGPDLAFRAYLLTALRRLHVDRIRATARLHTTDDLTPFDPGVPFRDTAVAGFENAAAARAFSSLPERWQVVLWHTEVEGQKPAEVAPLLGMTPNSVAALAYRAREGLRQAFLSMHAQEAPDDGCAWTRQHLGGYVRGGLSKRDNGKVEAHVQDCRACAAIYLELGEVNSQLAGLLAPLLLGGLASGYVASASGALAAKGGVLLLLDRARDLVAAHAPASVAAGVTATAVLGGLAYVTLDDDPRPVPTAEKPAAQSAPRQDPGPPVSVPSREQRQRAGAPSEQRPTPQAGDAVEAVEAVEEVTATLPPVDAPSTPSHPAPDSPSGPQSPPPPPPPEPSPEPAGADVRVSASVSSRTPATYEVTVTVTGLEDGSARMLVTGSGPVVLAGDGRCGIGIGSGTCTVDASPATYTFRAVAPRGGTLTFTVPGAADDPDRGNNATTVRLA